MIKLKNILREIGEGTAKPFPWKYHIDPEVLGNFEYSFEADNGTQYDVDITLEDDNEWEIGFSAFDGSYHSNSVLTGVGALRVMATITQILKDFLTNAFVQHIDAKIGYYDDWKKIIPKQILFSAHKENEDSKDGRRANLYRAFIQKQLPGAVVSVVRSNNNTTWYSIKLPKELQPKKTK